MSYIRILTILMLFSCLLSASETYKRTVNISVRIDSSLNNKQFILSWDNADTNSLKYYISKKGKGDKSWFFLDSVDASVNRYIDVNEENINAVEYKIVKTTKDDSYKGYGYIYGGFDVEMDYDRGTVILLIDDSLSYYLADEIRKFEYDLVGDGYRVIKTYVERKEEFSSSAVSRTKSVIEKIQSDNPNEKLTIIILGRVPVPYSGNTPWDGHNPDHAGAWATDLFYAIPRAKWTDQNIYNILPDRDANKNIPGDGKFDQSVIDKNEIMIGRIDMFNLTYFKEDEVTLIKRYLRKNNEFRHKMINVRDRALIDDGFKMYLKEAFAANGWMNFTSLLGVDNIDTLSYRQAMKDSSFLWSYGCNQGAYDNIYQTAYSSEMAIDKYQSVFTLFLGSYLGDWDTENNLLRSAIASEPSMLTAVWSGRPFWFFHHMALGEPIGYSALISQNNNGLYESTGNYGLKGIQINLIGDPTLRMEYVAPPKNLIAKRDTIISGQRTISLTWEKSSDDILGYHIFRSTNLSSKFIKLNSKIITDLEYTDNQAPESDVYYMVRAIKHETAVSGTYYNLSQGDIFEMKRINSVNELSNDFKFTIFPNPSSDYCYLSFNLNEQASVSFSIVDMSGRLVFQSSNKNYSQGENSILINFENFDNINSEGVFLVFLKINQEIHLGKLLKIN